eukprot:Platyproteum_vivax@DN5878_c0_g1_i3.p1
MFNLKKKLVNNDKPTELDEEVARVLFEMEAAQTNELKQDLKGIYVTSAKKVAVIDGHTEEAIIIFVPFKYWVNVKRIHGRLIRELEKKFSKTHIVLICQRQILPKDFRKYGHKCRSRTRTLTHVHENMLEDIVAPTEIVGKRLRVKTDSSQILKVLLDPKDRDKDNIQEKLATYSAVYRRLTNKEAVFMFSD